MMAVRLTGRRSVVVARSVHPEYREVLTHASHHENAPFYRNVHRLGPH